jgi:hypothetical protein
MAMDIVKIVAHPSAVFRLTQRSCAASAPDGAAFSRQMR